VWVPAIVGGVAIAVGITWLDVGLPRLAVTNFIDLRF
jgi:hypothetical protein